VSVEAVTMYRVLCDRCGRRDESDDYYCWVDPDQALTVARESEWLITDDGQWCPDCTTWDEEADEEVPLRTRPNE
jgi:hypothetical protein